MSDFKYRIIALGSAVVLGICSLALIVAIMGAIMGLPGFERGIGAFLAASYGLLALGIPAFLFYAAVILADKEWRPDQIFILALSIFPFMTLTAGVVLLRDYETHALHYAFLKMTGKTGFSFFIIALTVLEVLFVSFLKTFLFPRTAPAGSFPAGIFPFFGRLQFPRFWKDWTLAGWMPWQRAAPDHAGGGKENTDGAAAEAAGSQTNPASPDSPAAGAVEGAAPEDRDPALDVDIMLPELRPLASAKAMKNLDPLWTGGQEDPAEEQGKAQESPGPEAPAAAAPMETVVEVVSVRPKPVPKTPIRGSWKVPVDILNRYPDGEYWIIDDATRAAAATLRSTLEEFHIQAEVTGIRKGPVITMFEILPAPGVKLSKIVNLQDNIALRLAASSVRIVAPIPGKHAVGIEVPNPRRNIVSFREIIEGELHRDGKKEGRQPEIPVVLGKD
ncbi:MAG: DNA translocase FtsK, partial [Treponema sp.]|nr:DNA translocase FtsK [Treponema sp.]